MKPGKLSPTLKTLAVIFLFALIVRILPVVIFQVPAGLDSYLHIDIALRIVENGTLLSFDPLSLIGLKAYSYPPGFHALLAFFLLFLPPVFGSHLVGALIGALTAIAIFFLSREIFRDDKIALFSAFFFAASPIHIFRTAMAIPEGFGVMLFVTALLFLVRYLKTKDIRQLVFMGITFTVYIFSHRGWSLFILSAFLLLLVYHAHIFRKKRHLAAVVIFIAAVYYAVNSYMSDLVSRINVEAVTAIGYLKWMGGVQLAFAAIGMIKLHRTKDRFQMFILVWAVLLLAVGSVSFRFRDPYAAIPLSILAGYAMVSYVIPKARKKKLIKEAVALVILATVAQAIVTAVYFVEHPGPGEMSALSWIKENTPQDSTILTWKEEGYYIMGVTERKDILTWKKIYQGFFEEPPSVADAQAAYTDMFVMFRSANMDWMLKLMDGYSVDYIYIDSRMRSQLDALKYGLVEHLSHSTYFRPVYANDEAEVYKYEPVPVLPENSEALDSYIDVKEYAEPFGTNNSLELLPYLEDYWNGIAYLDHRDFRAHYPDISEIVKIHLDIYEKTGNEKFYDRAEWLMEWLAFEQLPDGAYFDQKYEYPKKSTAATCIVAGNVISIQEDYPDIGGPSVENAESFIASLYKGGWLRTLESSDSEDYRSEAACLPAMDMMGRSDIAQSLAERIISAQNDDGSWPYGEFSDRSTVNSQSAILSSLTDYYELTGDSSVKDAIEKGAVWLSRQQNSEGMFWNFVVPTTGRVIRTEQVAYPQAISAYRFSGLDQQYELTKSYFTSHYDPERDDLETLVKLMS